MTSLGINQINPDNWPGLFNKKRQKRRKGKREQVNVLDFKTLSDLTFKCNAQIWLEIILKMVKKMEQFVKSLKD